MVLSTWMNLRTETRRATKWKTKKGLMGNRVENEGNIIFLMSLDTRWIIICVEDDQVRFWGDRQIVGRTSHRFNPLQDKRAIATLGRK